MRGFQLGHQKVGGRQKNSENKLSKEARELFLSTLEGEVPHIKEAFHKVRELDPIKYLELFSKYASYFIPKKIDVTTNGESAGIPITAWANGSDIDVKLTDGNSQEPEI